MITSSGQVVIKSVCGRIGLLVYVYFVRIPISILVTRSIILVIILCLINNVHPKFFSYLETLHLRLRVLSEKSKLRFSNST